MRYGECDPQGIVFNANYLAYFDVAFTELWREAIGPCTRWSSAASTPSWPRRTSVPRPRALRRRARAPVDVANLGETSIDDAIDVVRDGEVLSREPFAMSA